MCLENLSNEKFIKLEDFIKTVPNNRSSLIEVLHKAQQIFGYLPNEVQDFVGEKLNVPTASVYGVITFYSYFTTLPRGKYVINICTGTACFVLGASDILGEFERRLHISIGETTPDKNYTLESLRCIGACGLAPVVTVNGKVYGHFKTNDVIKILEEYSE
ncbi:NAD(P)H-dependent oxidoreductase subunit E [Clostridium algoriphilum]|uniref:NADH-quinone oxidoreductase subunit NuoE family protein n=1 Tax=Clostridium algoriphilum TaxID=198347 RepID=UPI001CF4783A|nr:NAD(P)H-dependent oxidoreductase subunit E [Clostridium algoriphilum]MCB2293049.1 NAD(P)H-dependent oxidoreductase subunit E [Clostridium algoriphilum]